MNGSMERIQQIYVDGLLSPGGSRPGRSEDSEPGRLCLLRPQRSRRQKLQTGETQPAPETLPQEGQPSEETTMEETEAPVDGTTASEELQTGEDAETEAAEKAAAQPETAAQGKREASPML